MRTKTIAIIGVDGTGKSSVIRILQGRLQDQCCVQYMGYRDFTNPLVKNYSAKRGILSKCIVMFGKWIELKERVKKAKRSGCQYIIFDRYTHEIFINATGLNHIVYLFLFKYLFVAPDNIVYLHCSADTSFERKDDIIDKDQFKKMKRRFDNEFLKNEKVLSLNTDEYSSEMLADIIIGRFCQQTTRG